MRILKNKLRVSTESVIESIIGGESEVYIYGTNNFAVEINSFWPIKGFIDDFTSNTVFCGKPIINGLERINNLRAIIINCNVLGRPWIVQQKIDSFGFKSVTYFDFLNYRILNNLPIVDTLGLAHFYKTYEADKEIYERLFVSFLDLQSKIVLENYLNFKINLDISFVKFHVDRQVHQYIEDFIDLDNALFIDIGGYDGNNTLQLLIKSANSRSIIIEPEPSNINRIKENLPLSTFICDGKVEIIEAAVGAENGTAYISVNGQSSGLIYSPSKDNVQVKVITLDSLLKNYRSNKFFIKMDIEGYEMNALKGAEQFIIENKPQIAVCVYHKKDDIARISNYVLSLRSDYNVYLRHYTEGVTELVMFFI